MMRRYVVHVRIIHIHVHVYNSIMTLILTWRILYVCVSCVYL